MAKEIKIRLDPAREQEVDAKLEELGLKSYQELWLRLWDSAGKRLRRDGSLAPSAVAVEAAAE